MNPEARIFPSDLSSLLLLIIVLNVVQLSAPSSRNEAISPNR
jgi:hypothetical protein